MRTHALLISLAIVTLLRVLAGAGHLMPNCQGGCPHGPGTSEEQLMPDCQGGCPHGPGI